MKSQRSSFGRRDRDVRIENWSSELSLSSMIDRIKPGCVPFEVGRSWRLSKGFRRLSLYNRSAFMKPKLTRHCIEVHCTIDDDCEAL